MSDQIQTADGGSEWAPLYAIAGHMLADFPLQSDEVAASKLNDPLVRAKHVGIHVAAMVPTVLATSWSWRQRGVFLATLAATHFAIDSRRWAEPREGFETRPIWFDQAYHIVALAVCAGVTKRA